MNIWILNQNQNHTQNKGYKRIKKINWVLSFFMLLLLNPNAGCWYCFEKRSLNCIKTDNKKEDSWLMNANRIRSNELSLTQQTHLIIVRGSIVICTVKNFYGFCLFYFLISFIGLINKWYNNNYNKEFLFSLFFSYEIGNGDIFIWKEKLAWYLHSFISYFSCTWCYCIFHLFAVSR